MTISRSTFARFTATTALLATILFFNAAERHDGWPGIGYASLTALCASITISRTIAATLHSLREAAEKLKVQR